MEAIHSPRAHESAEPVDTITRVVAPEGVEFEYRIAGPGVRAMASLVDELIKLAMTLGVLLALAPLGWAGMGVFLVLLFLIEYFYFVTYAMILYVAVNYVLFTKTAIRIVHYQDNLIAKILFWPTSQFALLLFTLMTFY